MVSHRSTHDLRTNAVVELYVRDLDGDPVVDVFTEHDDEPVATIDTEDLLRLIGPQRQVEQFHATADTHSARGMDFDPNTLDDFVAYYRTHIEDLHELIKLRKKLIHEEAEEAIEALDQFNMDVGDGRDPSESALAVAKELADVMVVTVGTAARLGLQVDLAFTEVAASNLSKVDPPAYREDGKIQKGPNYQPPNPLMLHHDRRD